MKIQKTKKQGSKETSQVGSPTAKKQILSCFLIPIFSCFLISCLYSADLGIDVGNKSIDFSLREMSSTTTFKLSDYEGKNPILVNFFATWCSYCAQEIPELNNIYKKYGEKGLIVVSVNLQEREEKIVRFAEKKKIRYKILLDINAEVAKKFKVYSIPTNILVDSRGIIVFRRHNLPDGKEIKKILVEKRKRNRK